MNYPLTSSSWDEKELEILNEVIISKKFTMAEKTAVFEERMAQFLKVKYCVMVNSGSSANLLAIASLFYVKENPLKKGDEVIVPAISWATTYGPLYLYGLKLRFVDVNIDTLNIDLDLLEEAITPKTKAVFSVSLLGNPNDFNKLKHICDKYGLILLEDNCESLGAKFLNQHAGTFGLLGTFSTYYSHHISTIEGGIIATNNKEIYHILLSLRSHGWTRSLPFENLVSGKKHQDPFEESFKFVLPGYNLRPHELSAALGIEQLKKLPDIIKMRRRNARFFYEKMKRYQDIFYLQKEVGESSFFAFPLVLKRGTQENRKELVALLIKNHIEVRPIVAGNFVNHPVIKYFDYNVYGNLINADKVHNLGFFIGNHHYNLEREICFFVRILREHFLQL